MVQMNAHFTYGKLLKFVLPSIIMMIFTSVYGVVDGIFVSNFVGGTPFAALNFIMPFVMLFGAIGFMLGCVILFVMGIEWIALVPVIFN